MVETHAGDLEAAERVLAAAGETLETIGETAMLGAQRGTRSILAQLGRTEDALEVAALQPADRVDARRPARWRRGRSAALARLGQHEEAAALAEEAVRMIDGSESPHGRAALLENLGEVLGLAGREGEAEPELADALVLYERKVHCLRRPYPRAAVGGRGGVELMGVSAGRRRVRAAGPWLLALAMLDLGLEQFMIVPLIPAVQQEEQISLTTAAWLGTGFSLAMVATAPILGRLGDLYGKRRVLLAALSAFALGSLVCALADSIEGLIAGRVIQGAGAATAGLRPASRDLFPRERSRS